MSSLQPTNSNSDSLQAIYQAGKAAFERGEYRQSVECLEAARSQSSPGSRLGGEIQIWLVTAYEAAGRQQEAIALCRQVSQHPDLQVRKQGKRLLYILEAPKLQTRPEWLTQIPDLAALSDQAASTGAAGFRTASKPEEKPVFQLEPPSSERSGSSDNRFFWLALVTAGLVLLGLVWLA